MQQNNQKTQNTSRIERGWQLTKSTWYLLMLNKKLLVLPLISLIIGTASLTALFIGFLIVSATGQETIRYISLGVLTAVLYLLVAWVTNFCNAALIYGVTKSFNNEKATIRESFSGAHAKGWPIFLFSLLSGTIGLVLETLENRFPVVGTVARWIFGAAWSVATIFALPVIVLSPGAVRPIAATKLSIQLVKQTWGEGIVAGLGLGIIGVLSTFLFVGLGAGLIFIVQQVSQAFLFPVILALVIGFMGLILILGALNSIAQAAFYYYAVTGQAPAMFNRALLQLAMTKSKARGIFS